MKKKLAMIGAILLAALLVFTAYHFTNVILVSAKAAPNPPMQTGMLTGKVSDEDLSGYFNGTEGCFVLYDKNADQYTIYNEKKSQTRISPCSTFKIVNSLIGLESGVLQDENTVYRWSGKKYPIDTWNSDQTLATAFLNSVVWYYQQLAVNVGMGKMQKYLNSIPYGNANMSGGLTNFWLASSLKISPLEQVELLKNFYDGRLPFSSRNIDIVKKIMVLSDENGVRLSGKTGMAGQGIGWFVGYVENGNDVRFFATLLEGGKQATGANAVDITRRILQGKNIMP